MSDETDQQTKTVDLRVDRVTPWWLFAYLGAVLVALLFAAIQLRAVSAGLVTLQTQCVAAQAAETAVPAPTPAPTSNTTDEWDSGSRTRSANAGKSRISTPATAPAQGLQAPDFPAPTPITRQSIQQYRADLRGQE